MSQIFNLGLVVILCQKNGKHFLKFVSIISYHVREDDPFTKTTTSLNDHCWLSPLGGRIREFLLYL